MPLRSKPVATPDLYCITDARLSGMSHEEQMSQMLTAGARLIQLRDKELDDSHFYITAQKCQTLCRWNNAMMIINDRVQVAAALNVDGIHIGQEDLSPTNTRLIVGDDMIIGLSTHNREQFRRALDEPVNYIALGPVFGTTTKARPDPPPGMDLVEEAIALLANDHRPLVLIGGITMEKIPALRLIAPKAFFAVVGGIVGGDHDISAHVKSFRAAITGN